ncbi:hypothetical protein GCM10009835_14160 [Planosporangium flavigriseum]
MIAGPNGVGKTHILRLIKAMLAGDLATISEINFDSTEVEFGDGTHLIVERVIQGDNGLMLRVEAKGPKGGQIGQAELPDPSSMDDLPLPFRRLPDGRFLDVRTGRIHNADYMRRRYGVPSRYVPPFVMEAVPWLARLLEGRQTIFIDTKRLDTPPQAGASESANANVPASRIDEYIEQVRIQVNEARRASLLESQSADQSFASRVLQGARTTVRKDELKRRYDEIAERNAELYRNGLSSNSVAVQFPASGVNPTERRVLAVFLEDWEKKIAPLLPVNEKLKTLRRIINEKFIGKTLELDKSGGLSFKTDDGEDIPVRFLSSGEQHILALFTMLLFSASRDSVVLIDEPEISLHAAWKHAFLNDITDVARIADLQVIMATHSSGIINGQWDLVQELGLQR